MGIEQKTWTVGGIGLVVSGMFAVLRATMFNTIGSEWLGVLSGVAFAIAVTVFAIGGSTSASVVSRKPLGVVAMLVVGFSPLLRDIVRWIAEPADSYAIRGMALYSIVLLVLIAGAGLIAAMQIARAKVVAHPWRWAPMWVFAIQAAAGIIPNLIFISGDVSRLQLYAGWFSVLSMVGLLCQTFGLGILALILAARYRTATVEIFRSSPD